MYVEMKHICKTFHGFCASNDVSFGIEQGKLAALLGPSGSGKTTILRMLAGLDHPDSGEIYIDGRLVNQVEASQRGVGFVFQNYALFRYMTVYDNIAFGLEVQKWPKEKIKARVEELLALISMEGLGKRYPNQLSGGQKQRVAFARALASSPRLLLLDEPFAAIDAKVRKELRSWLKDMIQQVGVTSIFVTHDQEEAIEVADQIIVTNQGRVEQSGTPEEIYRHPKRAFVAQFMGQSQRVEEISRFAGFAHVHGPAVIRSENLRIFPLTSTPPTPHFDRVIVESSAFRGSHMELTLGLPWGERLFVSLPGYALEPDPGQEMGLGVAEAYVLDGELAHTVQPE